MQFFAIMLIPNKTLSLTISDLSGSWQHKQWSETQTVVRNDCTATIKQKHSLF